MSQTTVTPRHIAIVMDGNGRWAKQRFLPRLAGHKKGVDALRRCVRLCIERGVGVLTVFAFSSENWSRPADEVSGLMHLLAVALGQEVPSMHREGVQLHFVGEREGLSEKVKAAFAEAEALTAANDQLILNVCFNYGGKADIVQAAQRVASQGLAMTEANLNAAMGMAHVRDPDLLIRTGGEFRISNFLLWQAAYSELYFSSALWPDFGQEHLDTAIADFARRERRFGKTSEQVLQPSVTALAV